LELGEKVSALHNSVIDGVFSKEEIRDVVFDSYVDGWFPFLFYQPFRDVVKQDLFAIFSACHKVELDLLRLNFYLLTLIAKNLMQVISQKFRPIALSCCSFKIFSMSDASITSKFRPIALILM
jgi:hypothetical protein